MPAKKPQMGRPPKAPNRRATSTVMLRVLPQQKAAWVRAARPGTLAAWLFGMADKASGFEHPDKSE